MNFPPVSRLLFLLLFFVLRVLLIALRLALQQFSHINRQKHNKDKDYKGLAAIPVPLQSNNWIVDLFDCEGYVSCVGTNPNF